MNIGRELQTAQGLVAGATSIAALTGSGISAESGVPTFRGEGGVWEGLDVMAVGSIEGFRKDPEMVWRFYNERFTKYSGVRPNAGHDALARLEQRITDAGGQFTLATQNIDGLHQMAGSRNVVELHGSGRHVRCTQCRYYDDLTLEMLTTLPRCPKCEAILRPDVVWFGEGLPPGVIETAVEACRTCDVFMTIGTSAVVYPAAGLIQLAAEAGARTIEVNLEATPASGIVDIALHGASGDILPKLVGDADHDSP
ncbi:MAG: SIR2 family NAD-dependent protein deacylase [Planctomycetota bacterium]|jgi:NAD-dependent deacetylase